MIKTPSIQGQPRSKSQCFVLGMIALVLLLPGCGMKDKLTMTADDAIVDAHGRTVLCARVIRSIGFPFYSYIPGIQIDFVAEGERVASGITDESGRVTVLAEIPANARHISARMSFDGHRFRSSGRIFHWSRWKPVIAVDIDETVSATDYGELFFGRVDDSPPIPGARQALWKLSKRFHILYISARPGFLQDKTRCWLRKNGFPPGAYAGADRLEACLHQTTYKNELLAAIRNRWPNVSIGLGDKKVDDDAYGANGMLTFIINPKPVGRYTSSCVMLSRWDDLVPYFEQNEAVLSDAGVPRGRTQPLGSDLLTGFDSKWKATDAAASGSRGVGDSGSWTSLLAWVPRTIQLAEIPGSRRQRFGPRFQMTDLKAPVGR